MSHVEPLAHTERQAPAPAPIRIGRKHYVRAPNPVHFPSEESPEEAVSETKRHLEARTTLYLLLKDALAGHAIGSDQFLYWDAADPRRCLSPDVFIKRNAPDELFDSWKVWERGAPELAVEIVSASDRRDLDWGDKLSRYQASGIEEVVRFDAANEACPLRVWDRIDGDLVERVPGSEGAHECTALGLWWVVVPSSAGKTLRLARDSDGRELLSTPDEQRLRLAEELAEERRARAEAEHRAKLAEHAREREAAERKREAAERKREAAERKRETEARIAAEQARDEALAELARLRAGTNGKSNGKAK